MSNDDFRWLIEAVKTPGSCPPDTVWYLFGSILCCSSSSSDIDILILYEKREDIALIRNHLDPLEMECPLDLLFMTPEEEAELGFIWSEGCIEIFPMCRVFL